MSISNLYAIVTSCKKSENFHATIFGNTWKNFILGPVQPPFDPKTSKQESSEKVLLGPVTLCKTNQKNYDYQFYIKLEKHWFGGHFGSF